MNNYTVLCKKYSFVFIKEVHSTILHHIDNNRSSITVTFFAPFFYCCKYVDSILSKIIYFREANIISLAAFYFSNYHSSWYEVFKTWINAKAKDFDYIPLD